MPGGVSCTDAARRRRARPSRRATSRSRFRGRGGGGTARAVDGVDLALGRGEIVALVGESGCGKTTLARTLLGLEKPTHGRGARRRRRSSSYDAKAIKAYRRRVQLVLQDPTGALNPRHTVYEAVAEGLRVHGLVEAEESAVAQALSLAGLRPPERFFLRYPHELSGGQRQRVVIAGALVLEPDIIVADEPVSSLDASVRGEILALLLRLRDELGLSLLVVTHDLGLAWNIADRVAVMYLGRIVEEGPTEAVLSRPEAPVHEGAALGRAGDGAPRAGRAHRRAPGPHRCPTGCRFHPRCPVVASGEAARLGIEDKCRSPGAAGAHREHRAHDGLLGRLTVPRPCRDGDPPVLPSSAARRPHTY